MKYYLFPYHTSLNRGCEALAVSIANILDDNTNTYILHDNKHDDISLIKEKSNILFIKEKENIKRFSFKWFKMQFYNRILHAPLKLEELNAKKQYQNALEGDIYIAMGGDNYCYGRPIFLYGINRLLKKQNKKLVFWGCSIEPSAIDEMMKNDLASYNLIIARESITYNALIEKKIATKITLLPDPAFTLFSKQLPLPPLFKPNDTIGINVSPLIMRLEKGQGITLKNYECLIEYILHNTNSSVALIPHVSDPTTDDRIPLKALFEKFKHTDRVVLFDSYNCEEIKGFISQCRIFIGARTHATIAAYSTLVPTLVVGYSVKALGIAKDIFGTHENYVIGVQELQTETDLSNAFEWILNNEDKIREHLKTFMPDYISKAFLPTTLIQELISEK